jgi:hypothetical protein
MRRFKNFPELTAEMAFSLINDLKADGIDSDFGMSNQSCSAYVEISVYDEDDNYLDDVRARFSDHSDRHGSDFTIRIDQLIRTVEEDGEYVATEINEEAFAKAVADAKELCVEMIKKVRANA